MHAADSIEHVLFVLHEGKELILPSPRVHVTQNERALDQGVAHTLSHPPQEEIVEHLLLLTRHQHLLHFLVGIDLWVVIVLDHCVVEGDLQQTGA